MRGNNAGDSTNYRAPLTLAPRCDAALATLMLTCARCGDCFVSDFEELRCGDCVACLEWPGGR